MSIRVRATKMVQFQSFHLHPGEEFWISPIKGNVRILKGKPEIRWRIQRTKSRMSVIGTAWESEVFGCYGLEKVDEQD